MAAFHPRPTTSSLAITSIEASRSVPAPSLSIFGQSLTSHLHSRWRRSVFFLHTRSVAITNPGFRLTRAEALLCVQIKYPENFFVLRGNHECASINRIYGFYDECKSPHCTRLPGVMLMLAFAYRQTTIQHQALEDVHRLLQLPAYRCHH